MTLGPSFHDQTAGLGQTTTASEFGARLKDVPAVKAAPVAGRATDKHAPRGTSEYNNRESWQMTNTAIYGAHLPRSELHTRYAVSSTLLVSACLVTGGDMRSCVAA